MLKLYKKWEVEIKRMNFIKEKINKLSFDKKTVIKAVGILVVFAVAIGTITLIGHNGKTTSSKEVQTTTVQETTTQAEVAKTKKVTKTKKTKTKKKQPLYGKKYKKLKIVKVYDDKSFEEIDDIDDDIAEVYKDKSMASDEAGVALEGCVVKVVESGKEWTKIKSGKVEGYIESKYVVKGKEAKKVLLRTEHVIAKIKSENVAIRKDGNKKAASIGVAYKKTEYPIVEISKNEKWVKIKSSEAVTGWIPAKQMTLKVQKEKVYTSEEYDEMVDTQWTGGIVGYSLAEKDLPKKGEARDLIKYASKFLGNRYVWGGTSLTRGADCSGFVQSVFRKFGHYLNRTAAEQAKNGSAVSLNKLKPGDLVFYHTDKRDKNRISHVAIYIGNGKVIHSANRKVGMVISTVGSPCAARRILTAENLKLKSKKEVETKKAKKKEETKHKSKDKTKEEQTTKAQPETKNPETETKNTKSETTKEIETTIEEDSSEI